MIFVVKGRETIPTLVASKGFSAAQIPPAKPNVLYAVAQPTGGAIRFCMDGIKPTSSRGVRILKDTIFEIWGTGALKDFLCINDGGTAKLEVIYMGSG